MGKAAKTKTLTCIIPPFQETNGEMPEATASALVPTESCHPCSVLQQHLQNLNIILSRAKKQENASTTIWN